MAKEKNPNNIGAIKAFIKDVKSEHEVSGAKEQSYRPDLVGFIRKLGDSKTIVRNEGEKREGVTPDIVVMRKPDNLPNGYIEAKDITIDIDNLKGQNINQLALYRGKFRNLIYTNNFDWNFYRDGNLVRSISIAKLSKSGEITEKPENYAELADYLQDFLDQRPQTIKAAKELAKYMARKTRIIHDAFRDGLFGEHRLESLEKQYNTIVEQLIRYLKKEEFADMYAQTVTYGLFVARLNSTPETFNREKLRELVPKNYPFLKDLFEFIANKTLGDTLNLYIDDLIEIYRATDDGIMKNYKNSGKGKDPFLHFYEDFLKEYDSANRKSKGVYYTPDAVVDFIVRGVDWVLKKKFGLDEGLANSERISTVVTNKKMDEEQFDAPHRVQILDPATGTGTFLAQVIRHIAKNKKEAMGANWSSYVDKDLLPRLHGFEIMMAPYVMCYLKLHMLLNKLDYTPKGKKTQRMSIYLTDSLTGANKKIPSLGFGNEWLEDEARGAKDIKETAPIMCVIGNPPYNSKSKNTDKWINNLLKDYKKEPNTKDKLDEDNLVPINNDYVKFIRMAQHMVEKDEKGEVDKNREGVVGMITGNGYLDGPTLRGMRWNLMKSFDEIYILDLHGDKIKNKDDKNVFDITTGVAILIAWKNKREEETDKPLAKIFHGDLSGDSRDVKFKTLGRESLDSKRFKKIKPCAPNYYFTPKDYSLVEEYEKGFKINKFMKRYSSGITTHRDALVVDIDKQTLIDRIKKFYNRTKTPQEIKDALGLEEKGEWTIQEARTKGNFDVNYIIQSIYRPFDIRPLYYDANLITRDRRKIMRHFLLGDNLGLITQRLTPHKGEWTDVLIGTNVIDAHVTGSRSSAFPLYLYPEEVNKKKQDKINLKAERSVNMDETIRKAIEDVATDAKHGTPDEQQIFDYIYGLLHAPSYRKLYSQSLKDDFPRIPYPKDSAEFWRLSSVGTKLRDLHLMKGNFNLAAYKFDGEDTTPIVECWDFHNEQIWINKTQYFANVPESAWETCIGGYQPAKEWLSDREGQTLETNDIAHYQKIIAVLVQTEQTMQTIKWSRP